MGATDGDVVGFDEDADVGAAVGMCEIVGAAEGGCIGASVMLVGAIDGVAVGASVAFVGAALGAGDNNGSDIFTVGSIVGEGVVDGDMVSLFSASTGDTVGSSGKLEFCASTFKSVNESQSCTMNATFARLIWHFIVREM